MLLVSTLILPLLLLDGRISRVEGLVLTLLALVYTSITVRQASSKKLEDATKEVAEDAAIASGIEKPSSGSALKLALLSGVGLVLLLGGGKVFVDGAVQLAAQLGLSERLILG